MNNIDAIIQYLQTLIPTEDLKDRYADWLESREDLCDIWGGDCYELSEALDAAWRVKSEISQLQVDLKRKSNPQKGQKAISNTGDDNCPLCGSVLTSRWSGVACEVCGYSFCY